MKWMRLVASLLAVISFATGIFLKSVHLYYLGFPDGGTALDRARRPVAIAMICISLLAGMSFGALAVGRPVSATKRTVVTALLVSIALMIAALAIHASLSLFYPGGDGNCYFCS
jgi:hypothetical protein